MTPFRVERLGNMECGYQVTILGLGEPGREAVAVYPKLRNRECLYYLDALTLCDDSMDYAKIHTAVTKADVLFIIADMTRDYENACGFADLHRGSCQEKKRTVLVNCGGSCVNSQLFDLTISLSDGAKPYRPIEMLVSDMHHGFSGIDLADFDDFLGSMPAMTYYEAGYAALGDLTEMLVQMREKATFGEWNGMVCCTIPEKVIADRTEESKDILEGAVEMVVDAGINGSMMMQADVGDTHDGRCRLAVMIGRVD